MTLMSVYDEPQDDFGSRPRWSANRKIDVVMRLLRGGSLEDVSRQVGVEVHRLAAWRDDFLESGKAGLKAKRPRTESDRRLSERPGPPTAIHDSPTVDAADQPQSLVRFATLGMESGVGGTCGGWVPDIPRQVRSARRVRLLEQGEALPLPTRCGV